jgi:hypothetical protein
MKKISLFLVLYCLAFFVLVGKTIPLKEVVNPDSISVDQNQLYLTDGTSLLIYDLETLKLKKKLGKKGEGPEEFMGNPQSGHPPLRIDVQTKDIIVNSFNKLSFFSKDGTYIKEHRVDSFTSGFLAFGKGFVGETLLMQEERYWLCNIFDSNLKRGKEIVRVKHYFQGPGQGFKVLTASRLYSPYDNKLFVAWGQEFIIRVYDLDGKELYSIDRKYERVKVTEKVKEGIINYFKTDPNLKEIYPMLKPVIFPDAYPAIRAMNLDAGKIYAVTYKKNNSDSKTECLIMDLKGKLLNTVYLDLAVKDVFMFYPFTIANDTVYQVVESSDDSWELRVMKIK